MPMKCETAVLQNLTEIDRFITILKTENVRSYLEVGSKFGGSLWRVGTSLPSGARVVSVDLPHGDTSFKVTKPALEECVSALNAKGYDAHFILGDSTDPEVVEKVLSLGPYDAVFIDANHTLPYVRKDWDNYSKMTRIIAFHDIGFRRAGGMPPGKKPIEVPVLWNEIKKKYKTAEIRNDLQDNGIGVLWL